VIAWGVTFVCVCASWVVFRAENITTAVNIYKGMIGFGGLSGDLPFSLTRLMISLVVCSFIAFGFRNLNSYVEKIDSIDLSGFFFKGVFAGVLFILALFNLLKTDSAQFLYYQF
jgi:hypothetical protein